MDMIDQNKVGNHVDLMKGLSTYSYPHHRGEGNESSLILKEMVTSINRNVLGRNVSLHLPINQILYSALMGKHKVQLGEMSEILYRRILGNSLTLEQLKDIYKFLFEKIERLDQPISFREAAHDYLPHIFQLPKDLYMAAMLKESFQAATSIVAYVGIHHFLPIDHHWEGAPQGVNIAEATRIPERILGETEEELIEKHALLDSMLEKRAWGEKYVVNPFSYLTEDLTQIGDSDLEAMKKCFLFHYKKYEAFKKMDKKIQIPTFEERKKILMSDQSYKRDLQIGLEMDVRRNNEDVQSDYNDITKLKLETYGQGGRGIRSTIKSK